MSYQDVLGSEKGFLSMFGRRPEFFGPTDFHFARAPAAATLFSLTSSAKRHELDRFAGLREVLT
jgi:hypothetical protein